MGYVNSLEGTNFCQTQLKPVQTSFFLVLLYIFVGFQREKQSHQKPDLVLQYDTYWHLLVSQTVGDLLHCIPSYILQACQISPYIPLLCQALATQSSHPLQWTHPHGFLHGLGAEQLRPNRAVRNV